MSRRSVIGGCRRLTASLLSLKHSVPRSRAQHRLPPLIPESKTHPVAFGNNGFPSFQHQSQKPNLRLGMAAQIQQQLNLKSKMRIDPGLRCYSSESETESKPVTDMKHQEIEGPTVERDLSPLANESREVTQSLLKTMYHVSSLLALVGLSHLALGAYSYAAAAGGNSLNLMISALAFGFPFAMAFMLRQSLKSMHFFQKMEQIGRLQIMTSTMQISKHLRLFFLRLRTLSFLCLAGLSFSFLYSLSSSL